MTSDANLWQATCAEHPDVAPLRDDLTVDLAVIGGGFTGCSAALEAARQGASVCLLEAETIGHGGSGRNVGLVNAGLWLPPDDVIAQMGRDAGPRLIAALAQAPAQVFDLIQRECIACEPTRAGTLHLAHSAAGLRDLRSRHQQGVRLGAPVSLLDPAETARRTGSAIFHGALLDPRAGTVQPLGYVRGLARAALASGARVHVHSPVHALTYDQGFWRLEVDGRTVRAKALLMATNAYHLGIKDPFQPEFVAVNYCQFATEPLSEAQRMSILPDGEGCWDTALVMSSVRMDSAGRLILGGIGNADGFGGALHAGWAARKLSALYPSLGAPKLAHGWSGRIAMTQDHIPKIVQFGPRALACFGYSGRGIGPGTVFGQASARALLSDSYESLPVAPVTAHSERFAPARSLFYETGAALVHAIAARLPRRA